MPRHLKAHLLQVLSESWMAFQLKPWQKQSLKWPTCHCWPHVIVDLISLLTSCHCWPHVIVDLMSLFTSCHCWPHVIVDLISLLTSCFCWPYELDNGFLMLHMRLTETQWRGMRDELTARFSLSLSPFLLLAYTAAAAAAAVRCKALVVLCGSRHCHHSITTGLEFVLQ